MADGVPAAQVLAKLLGFSQRDLAIRVARDLSASVPKALPLKPPEVRHMRDSECAEWLRGAGPPADQRELYARWLEWWLDRSSAMTDNENRLRGALWCYSALRAAYDTDKNDSEALEFGKLVREMLRQVWRIPEPPTGMTERYRLARKVVWGFE
jgi:hypothetical protein